jgi:glycosyltransferase involved in cell wall biosynthesis
MFAALLRKRADIYIAGEPADLEMARWAARLHGGRVVYMPFELYTGLSYGDNLLLEQNRYYEARFARTGGTWVVSGDISLEFCRNDYNLKGKTATVYNSIPRHVDLAPRGLRARIGATPDTIVMLYTGQVNRPRGLWDVLEALPLTPPNLHFAILGSKDVDEFRRDVARAGLVDRVHVLDAVPQNELMGYTAEADIGIIPIQDTCLSYRYCNPSKFFEFVGARLPLIVRDSLEQLKHHVTTHSLGEVFESGSSQSLAASIRRLVEDKPYRRRCAENARRYHEEVCWEIQADRLRHAILEGDGRG